MDPLATAGLRVRRNTPGRSRGVEMRRRGRKRQLGVEDECWSLTLAGVGTVEACRRAGITRKTGYRWRAERGGLPPLRVAEDGRGSRYLSMLERERIAVLRRQGCSVREVAPLKRVDHGSAKEVVKTRPR